MSSFARANTTAQWFADRYPGSRIDPNVTVVHTTEGTSWPPYGGGASAPHYTARPIFRKRRLDFRAHFPDEVSSRALRNAAGGVETNTLNAIQIELIGTCDPKTHRKWKLLGRRHIFWPNAPEWALRDLASFLVDMHKRHGVKLEAPRFLAYPESYGASKVRFSFAQWRGFYGVCGHQHVPENTHGDPGALPMARVIDYALEELGASAATVAAPRELSPTQVSRARAQLLDALDLLDRSWKGDGPRDGLVKNLAVAIRVLVNRLPER